MPESPQTASAHLQAAQYASVAVFVALVYDHLLTFEKEYTLIWRARPSLPKIIFLWIRYSTPVAISISVYSLAGSAAQLDQKFCRDWTLTNLFLQIANAMGIMNILITMRVYVLWNRTKWIVIVLIIVGLSTETTAAILFLYSSVKGTFTYVESENICRASLLKLIAWSWPLVMAFDCLVVALTAAKSWQLRKVEVTIPLMQIMYRDGFFFFLAMIVARVVNLMVYLVMPPSLQMLGVHFSFVLRTLAFSRLLLNLRDVANHNEWSQATSFMAETQTMTAFQVASRGHMSQVDDYGRFGIRRPRTATEEFELASVSYQ